MYKIILSVLILTYFSDTEVLGITGGLPVQDGEYPFMVSIRNINNCHMCGGTIIGDRWILTGSPCYSHSWFGYVKYGNNSLSDDCGPVDATTIKMDDALYNPWAYDRDPYPHDLALIHLSVSIPFSDNAQPVQLPELDESWPYNENGIILGWGGSEPFETQVELQQAEVPLYTDEYCIQPRLWNGWVLDNPFVMKCGGLVNSVYYCQRDYGGPLLAHGKQFGIISYIFSTNFTCGNYPGIFSPVSYFRKWIKDTTGI